MSKKSSNRYSDFKQALNAAKYKASHSSRGRSAIWMHRDTGVFAVRYRLPDDSGRWVLLGFIKDGAYYD